MVEMNVTGSGIAPSLKKGLIIKKSPPLSKIYQTGKELRINL
jgi:hypothetical protein